LGQREYNLEKRRVLTIPGVHRNGDKRFCGASTIVEGQSTVFANGRLISVDGDPNTHEEGRNKPVYGAKNVYIEGKLIICAVGDSVYGSDLRLHPEGPANPLGHSLDVIVYGGGAGGGIAV
jgi:hypothetical protein